MINYFNQQLQSIYASKRALAKEKSQSQNQALLALHPKFQELLKDKKQTELDIVKTKAKGLEVSDLQMALDLTNQEIKQYAQEKNLRFTPPYLCLSCKDTGYVDGKPCECLKEQYNPLIKENASRTTLPKVRVEDNEVA
ncbi:MAG: hypothetical protein K2H24_01290, partial [Clostridia bacterium]|nr:hypothetical protein [Clostridia bacterium]